MNDIKHRDQAPEPSVTSNNRAFALGMFTGAIIVILVFMALFAGSEPASADTSDPCDYYAAPATCNELNPPQLFTPAPIEKAPNCVEREEIGHCSELLAVTGQSNNLRLIATGVVLVVFGCIIALIVMWNRAIKRGDD